MRINHPTVYKLAKLYSQYRRTYEFIHWCRDSALMPGHQLEDPKLRMIRQYKQHAKKKNATKLG